MAERKIPVASVQVFAHDASQFEERWPRIAAAVEDAAARGAKLIVAPEGTVPAYVIGTNPVEPAVLARVAAHMGQLARRYETTIVYGSAHVDEGRTYNTGTVIDPAGSVAGRAEKQLLWHFDERWFSRGRALSVVETPVGRLGVLICADGRLPTLARTLVDRGAELLVMPTAWVTSGRDPGALENVQADFMAAVRARENAVPLVAANKAGVEAHAVAYCGKSLIVDAAGEVVARAGERDEVTLFGDIVVGGPPAVRASAVGVDRLGLPQTPRPKARIGITVEHASQHVAALSEVAAFADVDAIVAPVSAAGPVAIWDCSRPDDAVDVHDGIAFARVTNATVLDPAALVTARLAGVDVFVWTLDEPLEERWQVAFARTRAAELRAYVIVLDTLATRRAFAVDPDGAVVCGTFGDFRLAQFAYDRARSGSTAVAPRTDVLVGLRAVEALRAPA